jgi:hypothetical protein
MQQQVLPLRGPVRALEGQALESGWPREVQDRRQAHELLRVRSTPLHRREIPLFNVAAKTCFVYDQAVTVEAKQQQLLRMLGM